MKFEPKFYHIYNRGNRHIPIFYQDRNYHFFLGKIKQHIVPHTQVLAYCLMPNHFHLLVYTNENTSGTELNHDIGVMLRSYTRAINKQESQTGSLFQSATKAKPIKNTDVALVCFNYIHLNPLKAGLIKNLKDYKHSSYHSYCAKIEDGIINVASSKMLLGINLNNYWEDLYGYLPSEHEVKALF